MYSGNLSASNVTFLENTFPGQIESIEQNGKLAVTSSFPEITSAGFEAPEYAAAEPYTGLQLKSQGPPWVQQTSDWALLRVNVRYPPLPDTYAFSSMGTGVNAYMIDTGIRFTHNDFWPFPGNEAGPSRARPAMSGWSNGCA